MGKARSLTQPSQQFKKKTKDSIKGKEKKLKTNKLAKKPKQSKEKKNKTKIPKNKAKTR